MLVDDLEQGLAVVDAYAAEHLEIQTRDASTLAGRVRNAGAIFVGSFAPVSLGDTRRLQPRAAHRRLRVPQLRSVRSFRKAVHVIEYDEQALRDVAPHVVTLAEAEDLPGHGAAVRVRVEER